MTTSAAILESLTPAQERLIDKVAAEYISDISVVRKPDKKIINRWLKVAYGLLDAKVPKRVEICASPFAALKLANELDPAGKHTATDYTGFGDGGWLSFYDYFHRIGVLKDDEVVDVLALIEFRKVAWDTILFDECAIVVARPVAIRIDDEGQLHAAGAPSIEWGDGEKDFSWHGAWVAERIAMDPRSFTVDEYRAISNTEERRALAESGGWAWLADLLDAKIIDSWRDDSTALSYELMSCSDGTKLLRKQSPALKTGKQPTYIEPVHESLTTARAARKWQACPSLAPAQCEESPDLSYRTEA